MNDSQPGHGSAIETIDRTRGEQYRFLSTLLSEAPTQQMLDAIAALSPDDTAYGKAVASLSQAARGADHASVEREFFELFVGVGRGELLPYASFYQTGFLNERPLAEVRADLSRLGVARIEGRYEPEDHLALLLEVMADMAHGHIPADHDRQVAFFNRHLAPWAAQFFDDLAVAPSAQFYRLVAQIGRLFVDIEARGFTLAA
ncbi:TorD/DmsD family molecular chaperone [Paracoccus hibiscisoli]|uniref:Molecular chaperone TorD n=1 Tax=Paracoccus hibiscisoli TaxID=2023261 RepID=A0A4U0QEH9_9RHOB|nr:molecular chaperone TorD family protein [Paracoccus hibiscisoli]TJZ79911.1 molecular chaperone TorD [Paracoccus hibiscisoli]